MRGFHFFAYPVLSIIAILALSAYALAEQPQTNIRMNFGVWDVPENDVGISVKHTDLGRNERLVVLNK